MDSGGGYLISSHDLDISENDKGNVPNRPSKEESIEVRKLTQKQELRLMNYLDEAFQQIVRGYSKRYTTSSANSISTLEAYLDRMDSILNIIAEIPPVGPSAQLLINYLLRYTNEITDGIQGYEIGNQSLEKLAGDKENFEGGMTIISSLERTIGSLDLLDRVWSAVLRGNKIDLELAREYAKNDVASTKSSLSFPGLGTPLSHSASHEQHYMNQNQGRYSHNTHQRTQKDNHSVVGSLGYSTVGQTQRIRLRNVITLAKENLFTWMRTQLNAPLPPQLEGSRKDDMVESRNLIDKQGGIDNDDDLKNMQNDVETVKEESQILLEDVKTETENTNGRNHYDDLFSRQIDPDADEEDEENERENEDDEMSFPSDRKRARSFEGSDEPSHKRNHEDEDRSTIAPSDVESEATFRGSSDPNSIAVMRWDVAFARMFQKTLRSLSDIQDRSQRSTENEDHQDSFS